MAEAARALGRFSLSGPEVRAVWPVVDLGPRVVVDGNEVPLTPVSAVVDGAGDRLSWRLEGAGVSVDLVADAVDAVVSVQATVSGTGRLTRVDVERWGRHGGGLGQPLLGDGWFAALEHPGAEGLGLAVDHDLAASGPFVIPPVVVGRSGLGEELTALWDEVDRVRARPPGLVVLANNWYQLGAVGRMDEASVAAEIEGFSGIPRPLDWYCLDDPWDGSWVPETGIWGRLDPGRFPGGLPALLDATAATADRVGGIGLWISPFGGYFDRHDARVTWGRDVCGYEVQDGSWPRLCPAGDRYRRHLAESMGRLTAAGVGYWKVDGVLFDCPHTDHGHAVGPGGRTAQMDRFAALLDGIRAVDPAVVLTFTTGSNPSPWWLRHADFVWRGGLDDDAPAEYDGPRHERFATYIDGCLYELRDTSVPVSSIVTFSLVENGARAYRDEGEGLDAWARHCWLLVGRGTHHHDLYVAPDSLDGGEWRVLAEALTWARTHERVLARSRMVGGRPQAGEPYGFVSVGPAGEVIVCLRNPSGRTRTVSADVVPHGQVTDLEVVFGRRPPAMTGPRLSADLDPFEVVVVSGRWRAGIPPGPGG